MYHNNFPSLAASLDSRRCLAASTAYFLHAALNLRPPSVTVSTHTSAYNAVDFQSPAMPNARTSLCMQSVHYFFCPLRPLRTAVSRFPNTIPFFGNLLSLIRMSTPAHNSVLVRNFVSIFSRGVISRARLYEIIRWSGLMESLSVERSCTKRLMLCVGLVQAQDEHMSQTNI